MGREGRKKAEDEEVEEKRGEGDGEGGKEKSGRRGGGNDNFLKCTREALSATEEPGLVREESHFFIFFFWERKNSLVHCQHRAEVATCCFFAIFYHLFNGKRHHTLSLTSFGRQNA
jgi:hypothetical protein